ncbi:dynamin-related GTPase [Haematococcus lacustris]|uniref:Dynamin-related GTPase n=1 Tax=Haematococcus lacustris TaxID=44745 RepID=A0A6A0AB49_HAELA|nr:dynamin-related GTPase [Haematococcus lacustris]
MSCSQLLGQAPVPVFGGSGDPASSGLNVPGMQRWQKRFFIFSDTQRMLYYFKSAEDVAKGGTARGMVNVAESVVEDLDDRGSVRVGAAPLAINTADRSQLMIRLRSKVPGQVAVKDHSSLVVRAETMEQKVQWLARLRKAAEGPRRPPPPPGSTGKASLSC